MSSRYSKLYYSFTFHVFYGSYDCGGNKRCKELGWLSLPWGMIICRCEDCPDTAWSVAGFSLHCSLDNESYFAIAFKGTEFKILNFSSRAG